MTLDLSRPWTLPDLWADLSWASEFTGAYWMMRHPMFWADIAFVAAVFGLVVFAIRTQKGR